MSTYTTVLVGSGFGASVLLPGLLAHPGFQVGAIWSPTSSGRARKVAAEAGLAFYDDIDVLYRNLKPDLAVVATPPASHVQDSLAFLRRGSHVLVEKPLAESAAEAGHLLLVAQRYGRQVFTDFEFRGIPARAELSRRLSSEESDIGPLLSFYWLVGGSGYQAYIDRPWGWNAVPELGGGYVNAVGVHLVDFILWALGDVRLVMAQAVVDVAKRRDGTNEAEDGFTWLLELASGAQGVVHYRSASRRGFASVLEITGERGGYRLEQDRDLSEFGASGVLHGVLVPPPDWPHLPPSHSDLVSGSVSWLLNQVYRALSGEKNAAPTGWDGLRAQRVLDALRLAARIGGRVQV